MELTPNLERSFHVRTISMVGLLSLVDLVMTSYAYHSIVNNGPSMQLMFGFEVGLFKMWGFEKNLVYDTFLFRDSNDGQVLDAMEGF